NESTLKCDLALHTRQSIVQSADKGLQFRLNRLCRQRPQRLRLSLLDLVAQVQKRRQAAMQPEQRQTDCNGNQKELLEKTANPNLGYHAVMTAQGFADDDEHAAIGTIRDRLAKSYGTNV